MALPTCTKIWFSNDADCFMPEINQKRLIALRGSEPELPIRLVYWKDSLSEESLHKLKKFASENQIEITDLKDLKTEISSDDRFYALQIRLIDEAIIELNAWINNEMGNPAIASDIIRFLPCFLNGDSYYADLDISLEMEKRVIDLCQTDIPFIIDAKFALNSESEHHYQNNAIIFINSKDYKQKALNHLNNIITSPFSFNHLSDPEIKNLDEKALSNLKYRQEFFSNCYSPSNLKIGSDNQKYGYDFILMLTIEYAYSAINALNAEYTLSEHWKKEINKISEKFEGQDLSWSCTLRFFIALYNYPLEEIKFLDKDIDDLTHLWDACATQYEKENYPQLLILKMSLVEKASKILLSKLNNVMLSKDLSSMQTDVMKEFLESPYKCTPQEKMSWLDFLKDLPEDVKIALNINKYYPSADLKEAEKTSPSLIGSNPNQTFFKPDDKSEKETNDNDLAKPKPPTESL